MSRLNPCINCGSTNDPVMSQALDAYGWLIYCTGCGWQISLSSGASRQDIEAMWNRLWDMQQTAEQVHKLGVDLQGEAMKNILKDMED